MKLSKRLQAIADLIEKYKQGDILADIGTDHAYLPCYLIENKIIDKAYACDVASGPIAASIDTIQSHKLEREIIPLLGDGLDPIVDKHVDMISICGMGGKLTVDILSAHKDYLDDKLLILQSNTGLELLRGFLFSNGFEIIAEDIVKDAKHIYEIIVCKKSHKQVYYSKEDMYFGPILKKEKNNLFFEKWERQLRIQEKVLGSLDKDHEKYKSVKETIEMIEGELNEGK